jgi:hypothetical protein
MDAIIASAPIYLVERRLVVVLTKVANHKIGHRKIRILLRL